MKGRHQASHCLRHENLMGKYCCFQIFPLLSVVITVAVNAVLLKGAGLASTDGWKQKLSSIPPGPGRAMAVTHASQPDATYYWLYVISHNAGFSVSFSRTFLCRSAGLGCVHIHSNVGGLPLGVGWQVWSRWLKQDEVYSLGCLVFWPVDVWSFWTMTFFWQG